MHKERLSAVNGYTFIEILVAITILGIAVVPLLGFFSSSFAAISNSGSQTRALNLCRDQIEMLKAEGFLSVYSHFITGGNNPLVENDLDLHPGKQRITKVQALTIEAETGSAPAAELLQITVKVKWISAGREHEETLQAYLAER